MVDGALFDALEALARGIRGKQEPFGGIQLILAGLMPFQHCTFELQYAAVLCHNVLSLLSLSQEWNFTTAPFCAACHVMQLQQSTQHLKFGLKCMSSAMDFLPGSSDFTFVDLTPVQLLHVFTTVTTAYCAAVQGLCTEHQSSAGDFHQLPPVAKGKEAAAARKFAFEAATWRQCVHHCAQLTKVFRQVSLSKLHFSIHT